MRLASTADIDVCCFHQVTLLLPSQSLQFSNGDGEVLWAEVTDYNQRMSGQWRPVRSA